MLNNLLQGNTILLKVLLPHSNADFKRSSYLLQAEGRVISQKILLYCVSCKYLL